MRTVGWRRELVLPTLSGPCHTGGGAIAKIMLCTVLSPARRAISWRHLLDDNGASDGALTKYQSFGISVASVLLNAASSK